MSDNENPTNKLVIKGQVVGVYPAKKNKPNSYLMVFRTAFIYNGSRVSTESYIFVNTEAQLPEVNDVLLVTGLLSIYSNLRKDGDGYNTNVSMTENERTFVSKGTPRQKKEKKARTGSQNYNNSNYGQNKERSSNEYMQVEDSSLDTIDF